MQSRPGGSGAGAVQFLYSYGPRDGTLLGLFTETIGLIQLVQPEIGKWKVQDLAYLGSFANVNAAFMMRKDSPARPRRHAPHRNQGRMQQPARADLLNSRCLRPMAASSSRSFAVTLARWNFPWCSPAAKST